MTEPPCSCRYEYGGLRVPPHPFPKWMQDLWAEEIVVHLPPVEGGLAANSANLNKYCGVPMHVAGIWTTSGSLARRAILPPSSVSLLDAAGSFK